MKTQWKRRMPAMAAALLLTVGFALPAYAVENGEAAGGDGAAAPPEDSVSVGTITAIRDSGALQDIASVTVWTDDTDPLLWKMVELQSVTAAAVSPEGAEETLTLTVDWDTEIQIDEPGTYTVSAPILAPEGYAFGPDVLQSVSIPVVVKVAEEREPDVITSFADLSHSIAYAVSQGCGWDDFFARQFCDAAWRNTWPCQAADGTELSRAHITWQDPRPDTGQTGVVTVRGTAVLPEQTVLAEGVTLPEVEAFVSVQAYGQPELNCWYVSDGCIKLPWVLTEEMDAMACDGTLLVLVAKDGGDWTEDDRFFCGNDSVYLPLYALEDGASYQVRAVWDGGGTGVFSFDWDGQVENPGYIEGDRDGGDSDGNPPASIIQPPAANGGGTEEAGQGYSDAEESGPEPDDSGQEPPEPSKPAASEPLQPEPPREQMPFQEQVTDTYSLLSGTRLLMMRESGPVRFSKQGVTLTLSDAVLDGLKLNADSRFYIGIQKTEDGFSVAVEVDGRPVEALPDTTVQLPYTPAAGDSVLTLVDADGEAVCEGTYAPGPGVAAFSVQQPGQYTVCGCGSNACCPRSGPGFRKDRETVPTAFARSLDTDRGAALRSGALEEAAALKTVWRQLLALLLAVALGSALCLSLNAWDNKYTRSGAQPMEGLLILSKEELARTDVHFLIHGWAFYPGVLLTPEELAENGEQAYMVYTSIGEHTRFDLTGGDDPHGCGTYALTIELPEQPAEYALELPEIYSAYKLYLNGKLAMQLGDPDPESYSPSIQNRMVGFAGSGRVTILLAVSDYSHFYSGLIYPPAFGSPLALNLIRGARLGLAVCVSLVGLLGSLLACYLGLRMKHKNALLFAVLCFTAALFTSYPLLHTGLALPPRPWYALEIFGGYLMVTLVVLLQSRLCRVDRWLSRRSVCVGGVFCLLALVYGLCAAWLTVPVMRLFSALVLCFKIGAAFYLMAVSLLAIYRRIPQTAPLFYASAFYAAVLLWDRLLPAFEPVITGWFFEWGSLAMILIIGYTLWRDIVTAYSYNLAFAEEHRQMERQLAMQMEYANRAAERSAENRKLIHDFRQHLRAITEMASQIVSQPETVELQKELLRYLEDFPQIIPQGAGVSPGSFCNHAAVDALLQYYHAAASRQSICAQLAFHIPDGIPLSDVEWCSVLGNLLENAMEGCMRQTDGKRVLSISVRPMQGTFFLLVENSCDGRYSRQGSRFLSRKSADVRYGIGLESVRETVTRHGGTLDIYPLEAWFRVGITLPSAEDTGGD